MFSTLSATLAEQIYPPLKHYLMGRGEAEVSATEAVQTAVPAIVAGLVKHISQHTHHVAEVYSLLTEKIGNPFNGAVMQAANGNDLISLIHLGKQYLPKLLAGNAPDVADQIAYDSGISKAGASSLLALALPLVIAVMRQKMREKNATQADMIAGLSKQQAWVSKTLNGNVLRALGIASVSGLFGGLNNMLHIQTTSTTKTGKAWWKWLVGVLVLLAVAIGFKTCHQQVNTSDSDNNVHAASETEASTASEVSPAAESVQTEEIAASQIPAVSDEAQAHHTEAEVVAEADKLVFYFAVGKADVAEKAADVAKEMIEAAQNGRHIVLSGYTDSTGNADANAELAKQRAQAVQAFFVAQGVPAENIELVKPADTTAADGNQAAGRRVEAVLSAE